VNIKSVELVNILEERIGKVQHNSASLGGETEHSARLEFRGFEVKTVRLCLERKKDRRGSAGSWVKL
jgi:hypothetical protein